MGKDAMDKIMQNPPVKKTYRNNFLQKIDEIVEEGENAKIMNVNIRLFNLDDIDLHDEVAVHERLAEYFRIYAEADNEPTVAGWVRLLVWTDGDFGRSRMIRPKDEGTSTRCPRGCGTR